MNLKDLVERVVWTFLAAFVGILSTVQAADWGIDTLKVAALAGASAVVTLLKAVIASRVGETTRGSFSE